MITGKEAESFYKDLPEEFKKYHKRKDDVSLYVEKVCDEEKISELEEDIFKFTHDFTENFYACTLSERMPSYTKEWLKYRKEAVKFLEILENPKLEIKEITFRSEEKAKQLKAPRSVTAKVIEKNSIEMILNLIRDDDKLIKLIKMIYLKRDVKKGGQKISSQFTVDSFCYTLECFFSVREGFSKHKIHYVIAELLYHSIYNDDKKGQKIQYEIRTSNVERRIESYKEWLRNCDITNR
jgi:hypothetical protein